MADSNRRVGKAAKAACPRLCSAQECVGPALTRLGPPYALALNNAA